MTLLPQPSVCPAKGEIWFSVGSSVGQDDNYVWQDWTRSRGDKGDKGDPGTGSRDITIYRKYTRGSPIPAVPNAASLSWDDATDALGGLGQWSRMFPTYNPVTERVACTIVLVRSDDTVGDNIPGARDCAADGDLNAVFRKAATKPARLTDGTDRVPTGTVDTEGDLATSTMPTWMAIGHRAAFSDTWTWSDWQRVDVLPAFPGVTTIFKYSDLGTRTAAGGWQFYRSNTGLGGNWRSEVATADEVRIGPIDSDGNDRTAFFEQFEEQTLFVAYLGRHHWASWLVTSASTTNVVVSGETKKELRLRIEDFEDDTSGVSNPNISVSPGTIVRLGFGQARPGARHRERGRRSRRPEHEERQLRRRDDGPDHGYRCRVHHRHPSRWIRTRSQHGTGHFDAAPGTDWRNHVMAMFSGIERLRDALENVGVLLDNVLFWKGERGLPERFFFVEWPPAPEGLEPDPSSPTSMLVTWNVQTGLDAATSWIVQWKLSSASSYAETDMQTVTGRTSTIVAGLATSGTYDVRVRGVNATGKGPWTTVEDVELRGFLPNRVRNLDADYDEDDREITVSWDAPLVVEDRFGRATIYYIRWRHGILNEAGTAVETWNMWSGGEGRMAGSSTDQTEFKLTPRANGRWEFQVWAGNDFGISGFRSAHDDVANYSPRVVYPSYVQRVRGKQTQLVAGFDEPPDALETRGNRYADWTRHKLAVSESIFIARTVDNIDFRPDSSGFDNLQVRGVFEANDDATATTPPTGGEVGPDTTLRMPVASTVVPGTYTEDLTFQQRNATRTTVTSRLSRPASAWNAYPAILTIVAVRNTEEQEAWPEEVLPVRGPGLRLPQLPAD